VNYSTDLFISNLRRQSSGHVYFSIKDARSQLSCVLFRGQSVGNRDLLEDGKEVILQGDITVYEARGQYQILVKEIEFKGVGALQIKFEELKPGQQQSLRKLVRQLSDLEMQIASNIIVARRDLELLQEMDQLAFPQDIEVSAKREFSGWGKSPLYFPSDFVEDLASARIPGGR